MSSLHAMKVAVVGAGVLGLSIALALARAGASVRLVERDGGPNASSIAAGMLAPAFEAALDPVSAGHFDLLVQARDLWPDFLKGLGPVGFERCGARLIAPGEVLERAGMALRGQGAEHRIDGDGLFTPEDWRIAPSRALTEMRRAFVRLGGDAVRANVTGAGANHIALFSGQTIEADTVILACGYGGRNLAPELSLLTPIKGQLLRFDAGPVGVGPILRSPRGYVVPGADGAAAGASMQEGFSDLAIDQEVTGRLLDQALDLAPDLSGAGFSAFAGVRPATPDGLPMIGKSAGGVWLAAGARRNGWLFAPLAARLIAGGLAEGDEDSRLRPARFNPR